MMTSQNIGMMIAIPVSLAGVIGLVLLSGALPPTRRQLIERALIGIFFPLMMAFWGWYAIDVWFEGERIGAFGAAILSLGSLLQGVKMFRKTRIAGGTRT